MPKSSKEQIDEDEKTFIKILQKNSGDSIESIAKRCGFSRQKVWRIKKRLEKDKTIWGYSAVLDEEKLNLKRYFILIKRTSKPATREKLDTVIGRELKKESAKIGIGIEGSFYIHGSFDWLITITANHIREVKKFCETFGTLFSEGFISDIQVLEVIFPVEKNGIVNPNIKEIESLFSVE
ncbi:MAG: Lrp/AsnC family transcriptional regulator [Thermoplasmatales archaeon]|nr:MAG: Lrp/AsnC family transcriptional regulator [Thermoplasmatales archaeon]